MISEISNFVESIDADYFTSNLNPAPGLHVMIQVNGKGDVIENSYKSYIFKKDGTSVTIDNEGNEIPLECNEDFAKLEYYSGLVNMNKAIDFKKQIHSSSPFILWFKKENYSNAKDRIIEYYKTVKNYVEEEDIELVNQLEKFTIENLFQMIKSDRNYNEIKTGDYVKIYYNVSFDKIVLVQNNYLRDKIFVNDSFNLLDENDEVLGLSGFLNGANVKKKYMQHQTSDYLVNNRITQAQAINLYKFEKLLKSKPRKLPNPLPIFIEKEELNNEVIRLFGRKGVEKFHDIIKQMFENKYKDLTNYYLLNWSNTQNGIVINDIDYVSSFEYKIEGMTVNNVMNLNNVPDITIKNIFQFELEILQKIFSNSLIVKTKKGDYLFKYFDEIDSNYCSKTSFHNILSYRKYFYDFIYKSKREVISGHIFYKILMSEILDEILRNDDFDKTWGIKEKLNILFTVNKFFDNTNKYFGGIDMASQIPEFQKMMRNLFANENYHLENDTDYAFASGQLIYNIIKESKSSNKSHALLEPFINKSDPKLFHKSILLSINQYKHAFEWYGDYGKGRFEKLASEILGYTCSTNIKDLLPIILAGYFSQSMIFESKEKTNKGE